jgi:inhibitor of KinA
MSNNRDVKFLPLGDQALLGYFASEADAWEFSERLRQATLPGVVDVVQAYASVAVFYDLDQTTYASVLAEVRRLLEASRSDNAGRPAFEHRLHRIPCCYDFQLDIDRVAAHTGLQRDEVIRLHSETVYTVYAIGFCPGFPYLGYLPEKLCGVPRLESPRLRVEPGSVGLTGRQTGIYTEERPGGWNLLGRTPLVLVDVADGYFPLRTGDQVQFVRVGAEEYARLEGERL